MQLKKALSFLFISLILLTFFKLPVQAKEIPIDNRINVSLSYNPQELYPGESFTITAIITNYTYKEIYEEEDVILTNPGVSVLFNENSKYLVPIIDKWEIPVGSMEGYRTLTFTETLTTSINTPSGYFFTSVISWGDKDDPLTFDHETQGQPLVILQTSSNSTATNSTSTIITSTSATSEDQDNQDEDQNANDDNQTNDEVKEGISTSQSVETTNKNNKDNQFFSSNMTIKLLVIIGLITIFGICVCVVVKLAEKKRLKPLLNKIIKNRNK